MPSLSVVHVVPSIRRHDAPALPGRRSRASLQQAVHEPLELTDFEQAAFQSPRDAIDDAAADYRLADRRFG
jgi:hypothetical protein